MKKMARVAWKMAPKYQKNAKWPKITFRGPILVPEVAFWGFWGLVCIEKWSKNADDRNDHDENYYDSKN